MADNSTDSTGGHLRYYQQHAISPVRYQVEDFRTHFDRRDSLYRSLGLPPLAFRNARVLEVAAGSGQNSLYVASCHPASYDLVEPNPSGLRDIEAVYRAFEQPHTVPRLHAIAFEEFEADARYDIVLCENWLGSLPHEVGLIRKLASLVAPAGVLVLTMVPLSGFFANVMRKLLALRLTDPQASFEDRTTQLVEIFGPHLATIESMTRSHRDWVHDCMLNPHYLHVALPLETVLDAVGSDLEVLATFPRFTLDWRWFKGLTGNGRDFNAQALAAYQANTHNFIDYRRTAPPFPNTSGLLAEAFRKLHDSALDWQTAFLAGQEVAGPAGRISAILAEIIVELNLIDPEMARAVMELATIWAEHPLRPDRVRDMTEFGALFGRETVYIALTRPCDIQVGS